MRCFVEKISVIIEKTVLYDVGAPSTVPFYFVGSQNQEPIHRKLVSFSLLRG